MTAARTTSQKKPPHGTPGEVFLAFAMLGLTAFGGPIAHLGYFREAFVVRRRWLDDATYADLVALCQFLPGPASSQVGFALGLYRAGPLGALCAFVAFTLPSALLLIAFALGASAIGGPIAAGILGGLKIVAVAIVAQAVWGMARTLTPDRQRITIAILALGLALVLGGTSGQLAAIAFGAIGGLTICRHLVVPHTGHLTFPVTRTAGLAALCVFALLLLGLPLLAGLGQPLAVFDAFYRAGALVFGGGHVVLPLLESAVVDPGWITSDQFLAGYGAAQAVPGPLFTFAAYLGTALAPAPNGLVGALIALVAIFLPGFVLLIGALPFWDGLRTRPDARAIMAGTNAAVVGILAAALYDPVFVSAITGPGPLALALVCLGLLLKWKTPPWAVVIVAAMGGVILQVLGLA